MKTDRKGDSLERLIGDLIFKLGKANQQIHCLSKRVSHLEHTLRDDRHDPFTHSKSLNFPRKMSQ